MEHSEPKNKLSLAQFSEQIKHMIEQGAHDQPFPYCFEVVAMKEGQPFFIEVFKDNTCQNVGIDYIYRKVASHVSAMKWANDGWHRFTEDSKVKAAVKFWATSAHALPDWPKPIRFFDDNKLCYKRLDFVPFEIPFGWSLPKLKTWAPHWHEFLSRCNDHEALLMFIWSCFAKSKNKSQYLWLQGIGGDSKSVAISAVMRCLGSAGTYGSSSDIKNNSRWFTASLIGKTLCYIPEADPAFPCRDTFKAITGEGTLKTERKGKDPVDAEIYCKFIFSSNDPLELKSDRASLRRAIPIKVKPFEGTDRDEQDIKEEFYKEMKHVLGYGKQLYEAKKGVKIPVKQEIIDELTHTTEQDAIDLFEDRIKKVELSRGGPWLVASTLKRIFREAGIYSSNEQNEYKKIWSRRYGFPTLSHACRNKEGVIVKVYKGFTLLNKVAESKEHKESFS